ncbi:hypothetical protein, partial [Legionella beliardensis]
MRLTQPPFKIKPLAAWLITHITMSMALPITMSFAAEVNWPVPIATPAPLATAAANLNTAMTVYIEEPTPANAQALAQAQATYNQAVAVTSAANPTAILTVSGGNQDTINGNDSGANSFFLNNQAAFIHATGDNTSLTVLNHIGNNSAILLSNGSILDINAETGAQVIFTNNTAGLGGAISINQNSTLSIANSTFIGNIAETAGGAVSNRNSFLTIASSTFIGNTAYAGGALFSTHSTLNITDSTFNNNTATGSWGGVIASGDSLVNINHSIFSNNQAVGAAGVILAGDNSIFSITNSTFSNNTASNFGGAIYNFDSTINLLVTASNVSQFIGNTANGQASSITLSATDVSRLSSLNAFIEAGGVLDMRDPMDSTDNAGEIAISQTGQGT